MPCVFTHARVCVHARPGVSQKSEKFIFPLVQPWPPLALGMLVILAGVMAMGGITVAALEVWDTPMGGPFSDWKLVASVPLTGPVAPSPAP